MRLGKLGRAGADDVVLVLVDLGEDHDPARRLVGAGALGLVKAEGLECSSKGEEKDGGSDKDADVEMGLAEELQGVS